MSFETFLERLMLDGLEYFRRFYGIYRGEVTDNADPQLRGRVKALVPEVGHNVAPDVWIDPAFCGAGSNRGGFHPPEIGDSVRVSFEAGDPGRPNVYFGGWFGRDEVPSELGYGSNGYPERRGIVTRAGHVIVLNDESGSEAIEIHWHKPAVGEDLSDRRTTSDRSQGDHSSLKFESDGSIVFEDKEGQQLKLDAASKKVLIADANGNEIVMDAAGITLKAQVISLGEGATSGAMKFTEWMPWEAGHGHPTSMGPTGAPSVPPPSSIGSTIVKVK
jgi:hypothetical protein